MVAMADEDVSDGYNMPCSHETLQQTVHGVIYTESCYGDILVDVVTNRLLELLPELKSSTYSIIICPEITYHDNTSECSNSVYVAELVDIDKYKIVQNDVLTRISLAALKPEFTVSVEIMKLMTQW